MSPAVPLDKVFNSSDFDRTLFNHEMSFDILYLLTENLDATKLGTKFTYDYGMGASDFDFNFLMDLTTKYEEDKFFSYNNQFIDVLAYQYYQTFTSFLEELSENDDEWLTRKDSFFGKISDTIDAHSLKHFYPYLGDIYDKENAAK